MPVNIQGKQYVMVNERVQEFHAARDGSLIHIETWKVDEDEKYITMAAKVTTAAGTFTGHSRGDKTVGGIQGRNAIEDTETSAVGRALGFAGYGVVESIASADEVQVARTKQRREPVGTQDTPEAAARRKLWAVAKEQGMDEAALKGFLSTESVKALAEHMAQPKGDCTMTHPHGLRDVAEGYRTMARWLEAAK